jgi:quercetin dioxygenase-like cupin family protein
MKASTEPDSPLATPALLADLADYHTGSIVSRTLLKSPGGSLTMFAFAEGESLSEHTTPHDAVVLVVDGLARITVGGRVHEVSSGELLLMPANVPHAVYAEAPFKMLLVMLRSGD